MQRVKGEQSTLFRVLILKVMKISELIKKYVDEIVEMYDDCDLEELTEEQKEDLMILIHKVSLMIVTELSELSEYETL